MRFQAYKPRAVRFLELWHYEGWRVKVYGITYDGERPHDRSVAVAKELVAREFPLPAVAEHRYGVAVLIVHEAADCYWYVLDVWSHENALQHRIYSAPFGAPERWEHVTMKGPNMCVWELGAIAFEREAWIDFVMRNPSGADLEGYLDRRLNGDI